MAENFVFNTTWAEGTSNKDVLTPGLVTTGIQYQGPVVSSQLNGLGNIITRAIAYQQQTGGYYSPDRIYQKNDICCLLHAPAAGNMYLGFFRCISETPIQGVLPLLEAEADTTQGVVIFSGGKVNRTQWQRVDSSGAGAVGISTAGSGIEGGAGNGGNNINIPTNGYIKFLTVTPPEDLGQTVQPYGGKLTFLLETTDGKVGTFELIIDGNFVKKSDGTVDVVPNFYGDPLPDIRIENVRCDAIQSTDTTNDSEYLRYGLRFEVATVGRDPDKTYHICIKPRTGIANIKCTGNVDGVVCELDSIVTADYTSIMWIPVIEGATNGNNPELGKLFEIDFNPSAKNIYDWGAVDVSAAVALTGAKYGLFNRRFTRGSPTHAGTHTRVAGGSYMNDISTANRTPGTQIAPGVPRFSISASSSGGSVTGVVHRAMVWDDYWTNNIRGAFSAQPLTDSTPNNPRLGMENARGAYHATAFNLHLNANFNPSVSVTPNFGALYKSINDVRPHGIFIVRLIKVF